MPSLMQCTEHRAQTRTAQEILAIAIMIIVKQMIIKHTVVIAVVNAKLRSVCSWSLKPLY